MPLPLPKCNEYFKRIQWLKLIKYWFKLMVMMLQMLQADQRLWVVKFYKKCNVYFEADLRSSRPSTGTTPNNFLRISEIICHDTDFQARPAWRKNASLRIKLRLRRFQFHFESDYRWWKRVVSFQSESLAAIIIVIKKVFNFIWHSWNCLQGIHYLVRLSTISSTWIFWTDLGRMWM